MNPGSNIASVIRTNCAEKLTRTISLKRMNNSLMELFMDKTKQNTVNKLNSDGIRKVLKYKHCKRLNDTRRIEFGNSCKQDGDVFDETRQIWISPNIDIEKDDLFIPNGDVE